MVKRKSRRSTISRKTRRSTRRRAISRSTRRRAISRKTTRKSRRSTRRSTRTIMGNVSDVSDVSDVSSDVSDVSSDVSDEPPFKGQKWIMSNGKKIKGIRKHFKDKFLNPAIPFSETDIRHVSFEGDVEDGLISHMSHTSHTSHISHTSYRYDYDAAQTKVRTFMKELEEMDNRLRYLYFGDVFFFIATNDDSSIIYEYHLSPKPEKVKIYVRGYYIQISIWKHLTSDERKRLLTDDEFLKKHA